MRAAVAARWFFFYGTLAHDHDNAMTRRVLPVLDGGQRAWVPGALFAVRHAAGAYPVLRAGSTRVWGRLYRARPAFRPEHLRQLDDYEEAGRRHGPRPEYLRRAVAVRAGGRIVHAQAYVHGRPSCAGLELIAGGDFTAIARRRGWAVFSAPPA